MLDNDGTLIAPKVFPYWALVIKVLDDYCFHHVAKYKYGGGDIVTGIGISEHAFMFDYNNNT